MKKPLNEHQRVTCSKAAESIANAEFLLKRPEFCAFTDRFKARADDLANQILHDDMEPAEREKLRNIRLGILEMLQHPHAEITASRKILRDYGEAGD